MTGEDFVEEMNATLWQLLAVREAALAGLKNAVASADIPKLLLGGLRQELEAAEIAARWVPATPEIEIKLGFARQAGDEARHYTLLAERLAALGVSAPMLSPLVRGTSKLFRYLEGLDLAVERVAAAQFAREAIGCKANELFIVFCDEAGDHVTADLYRRHIQPDELRHHEWGKRLLTSLAVDDDRQCAARRAILTTFELAEELRSVGTGRPLVNTLPGC
jgi:hypothetical protein